MSTECWSNHKNQSGSGATQNKGGKGKPKTSQAREQARRNRENKLQWWNQNRSQLLRAPLTWRRLKLLSLDHEGWLTWTYDTGAAIWAFPLGARIGTETQANDCSYKTASRELITDRGGLRVQGTSEYGYGVTFQGWKADVHKTLISASEVHSKRHVAVVDSNEGYIILYNSTLARMIQELVQKELVNELGAIRL